MAVYTHITEDALKEFLSQFDLGALQRFDGIVDGVENSNYCVKTTKGTFILTLFEKRIRAEDLPFYVAFMRYLNKAGIPCPDVICSKSGQDILTLNGKAALVTSFLQGQWPKKIELFHAEEAGRMLAQMHLAATGFPMQRENTMSLPAWRDLIGKSGTRADEVEPGLAAFLQQELQYISGNWPSGLTEGTVHADLFPDNVFFTGEKISGVIDFYFACNDSLAYDLMLTLNAWCFENGAFNADKAKRFLNGYQSLRPLPSQEQAALGFLGRAAALRIIATRLYDWLHPVPGASVKMKDPLEYVRILKFHQQNKVAL